MLFDPLNTNDPFPNFVNPYACTRPDTVATPLVSPPLTYTNPSPKGIAPGINVFPKLTSDDTTGAATPTPLNNNAPTSVADPGSARNRIAPPLTSAETLIPNAVTVEPKDNGVPTVTTLPTPEPTNVSVSA
jgi:hypothetical protein